MSNRSTSVSLECSTWGQQTQDQGYIQKNFLVHSFWRSSSFLLSTPARCVPKVFWPIKQDPLSDRLCITLKLIFQIKLPLLLDQEGIKVWIPSVRNTINVTSGTSALMSFLLCTSPRLSSCCQASRDQALKGAIIHMVQHLPDFNLETLFPQRHHHGDWMPSRIWSSIISLMNISKCVLKEWFRLMLKWSLSVRLQDQMSLLLKSISGRGCLLCARCKGWYWGEQKRADFHPTHYFGMSPLPYWSSRQQSKQTHRL